MSLFDFDPDKPGKLDPRKYGFDYGMGGPTVFDSNLFHECPSCNGEGTVETKDQKIEKCLTRDGAGVITKN